MAPTLANSDDRRNPLKRFLLAAATTILLVGCAGTTATPAPTQAPTTNPSPVPTARPTAVPTATATERPPATATAPASHAAAVYPDWYTGQQGGAGILAAGSHETKSFVPAFTFSVPDGWVNGGDETGFYELFPDTPGNQAEFTASGSLADAIHMGPLESPYFACDAWEDNSGATAAEMVAAIVANEVLATSDPIDVTIGGLTGKQIDVQLDPGWTETCPGDPPGVDLADMRARGILLDTADRGVLVLFVASVHSAGHEAFLTEAMPIIESFEFDVPE